MSRNSKSSPESAFVRLVLRSYPVRTRPPHTMKVVLVFLFCAVSAGQPATYQELPDDDSDPYKPLPIKSINPAEKDASYWKEQAKSTVDRKFKRKLNTNVAKNVIFFMGDGLSIPTIAAARIYQGQLHNKTGEEDKLFFENFSFTGLSKTYCVDKQVADSACSATAYMTGVKGNYQSIGVSAHVRVADCESAKVDANRPPSIVQWAQEAGKATGVVTNTRITHASPAGSYAHVPYRGMESDADVVRYELNETSCDFDIAKQLILDEPGRNIKVIMGGGRRNFLPNTVKGGVRLDRINLIDEWKKSRSDSKAVYVSDKTELENIDISNTDYLLGLFGSNHLDYHMENNTKQPYLWEMTSTAIRLLKRDESGFFLFVEGGRIDMAHHDDRARIALDETVEFAKAIEVAYKLTDESDTLIVVTADHAHTMSFNGYPARGHDILGIFGQSRDGLPYATLSYSNGPGYVPENATGRHNLEQDDMGALNYSYPALVPKEYESHGGDDVAVYANGPWSHLFTGNYEQNVIPIAEAFAAKIGPYSNREEYREENRKENSGSVMLNINVMFLILCILTFII